MNTLKTYLQKYMLYINLILIITGSLGLILFIVELRSNKTQAINYVDEKQVHEQNTEVKEAQFIDIEGQINKPGVYEIKRGETIRDIVIRADGFTKLADLRFVQLCMNLAEKVKDEQKIYVPAKSENFPCSSNINVGSPSNSNNKISLNNSTQEQLEILPGIGESTAKKIIEARPYSKIEDLKEVSGIGDATYEKLRDYIDL